MIGGPILVHDWFLLAQLCKRAKQMWDITVEDGSDLFQTRKAWIDLYVSPTKGGAGVARRILTEENVVTSAWRKVGLGGMPNPDCAMWTGAIKTFGNSSLLAEMRSSGTTTADDSDVDADADAKHVA